MDCCWQWQLSHHRISAREWSLRLELACAYQVAHEKGWDEIIYNHITLRCPPDLVREICLLSPDDSIEKQPLPEGAFFINSFGLTFDEVTPLNLLLVSYTGEILHAGYEKSGVEAADTMAPTVLLPALLIHSALHQARPDIQAIWHCHATPVVAVSTMKCGFLQGLSQESVIVSPRLSDHIHAFEGVVSEPGEEQRKLANALGPKSQVLLMANHGVVSCGTLGVCDAFYNLHLLVRACEHQVTAMSAVGGRVEELWIAPDTVVAGNAARMLKQEDNTDETWGRREWEAAKRQILRRIKSSPCESAALGTPTLMKNTALMQTFATGPLSSTGRKTKRLKLMVLHGFPGHIGSAEHIPIPSQWLRESMQCRGYDVHIVEPRAPTKTDGDDNGVAWIAGSQVVAGKVCGFYQRGWAGVEVDAASLEAGRSKSYPEGGIQSYTAGDLPPLEPLDNIWTGSKGYQDSLRHLEKVWVEYDGFDGILGFSQGALMASLFIAYMRNKNTVNIKDGAPETQEEGKMDGFSFAILCSGFARPWPLEASHYWPPALLLSDEDNSPKSKTTPTDFASGLLSIPSLHIIGDHDTVVAPCRSYELRDMYAGKDTGVVKETYRHDLIGSPSMYGGHVLPWTDGFHEKLALFLDSLYKT